MNRERRIEKVEQSLGDFWDNNKHSKIHVTGVLGGEQYAYGAEKIFLKNVWKLPKLDKPTCLRKLKQHNPHHPPAKNQTAEKTGKKKKKILRATREKCIIYRGTTIQMTADYSSNTMRVKRKWRNIFKCGKKGINVLYHLYQQKISLQEMKV